MTSDANIYSNLSPGTKFPSLSIIPILSPSPSNAIPMSALTFLKTFSFNCFKLFSSVGSNDDLEKYHLFLN